MEQAARRWVLLTAVALAVFAAVPFASAPQSHKPLSEKDVIDLLTNDVKPDRVAALAKEFGVTFEMTPQVESRLRRAGASDGLLGVVRELAPKPPASPVLEVHSMPGHAQVYVDQVFFGETSEQGQLKVPNLTPGQHDVRLSRDGYNDFDTTVLLSAGQVAQLNAALAGAKPAVPSPPPPSPPQATTPKRIRVGSQVEAAKVIFQPKPEYPPLAKMARIQGVVRLEAVIGKDGTIQDVKVLSGHPLLVKSALEAVQKWRYQPTLLNGEPVEVVTEIDSNFWLEEGTKNEIYSVGGGVSAPVAVYMPDPPYSEEARRAKYQGVVVLSIVVDTQGNVQEVHVVKRLGLGLDEKAEETVKTWKFKPAMRNGTPVPVRVTVEVTFQLYK